MELINFKMGIITMTTNMTIPNLKLINPNSKLFIPILKVLI